MNTNKLTAETITDRLIIGLRAAAYEHQDSAQVHICGVALGEEQPVDSAEDFEERYGGGGYLPSEIRSMMEVSTMEEARARCAEAINNARAMED